MDCVICLFQFGGARRGLLDKWWSSRDAGREGKDNPFLRDRAEGHGDFHLPSVFVVVPNYNGSPYVRGCLESILAAEKPRVVFVDDCSSDDSVDIVRRDFPDVEIVRSRSREGCAESKNLGARQALANKADFVAFMDVDTRAEAGWLQPLLDAMQSDRSLAAVGSLLLEWEGRSVHPTMTSISGPEGRRFGEHYAKSPGSLFYSKRLVGAAMMVAADALVKVGLFDPKYETYYEETDLCRRMLYHGYRLAVVSTSRVWHRATMTAEPEKVKPLFTRNEMRYRLKNPEDPMRKKILGMTRHLVRELRSRSATERAMLLRESSRVILSVPGIYMQTRAERTGPCYL